MRRREFFLHAGLGSAALAGLPSLSSGIPFASSSADEPRPTSVASDIDALDLSPALWIWYPSERCLPNTFVCFRKEIVLRETPAKAAGWIIADSRYRLEVNGQRIQWGPAPSDPRWPEVDPVDLAGALHAGKNVLGALVLFYGQGDGTWATGKPGLLFRLEVEYSDGSREMICSDQSWLAHIARSWEPGHYKRWYVRALQEEFDARKYPYGWSTAGFVPDASWISAMPLPDVSARVPAICSSYPEYALDLRGNAKECGLRARSIPFMSEEIVRPDRLASAHRITWHRPPREYFECIPAGAYDAAPLAVTDEGGAYECELDGAKGAALTFEFKEEIIGWPGFSIDAPEGTVIELMVQEHHAPGGPALLNTHYHSWARFVCRDGQNSFETFDYEACKWLQLHIHGALGKVRVSTVTCRRRRFPWQNTPHIVSSDPAIEALVAASLNTLNNSAQETVVDGMGRERQQYSGDGAHQLHALYYSVGETRLPARYLATFSQGITQDGFFLDCWPAFDRLARLWERQIQLSYWGPLLDHGVGFVFDCWHHYMYTADSGALREPYPRLLRFFSYLQRLRRKEDGLISVEGLGVPSVYIDHLAYRKQRHKECAFNLYAGAMMLNALAPLCTLFGDRDWERAARQLGKEIINATVRRFWSGADGAFVVNQPWLEEETEKRFCDRSLALAVMFDLFPDGDPAQALRLLADCPPSLGLSYPANACWRLWALGKGGRTDVILKDFQTRWMTMASIASNNTLQEFWNEQPDGGSVMSHCGVVPLYILFMEIAGVRPSSPGFTRCTVRPQPAGIERLELTAMTVRGPLGFISHGHKGKRTITLSMPGGCTGELRVDSRERLSLNRTHGGFELPAGKTTTVTLTYS